MKLCGKFSLSESVLIIATTDMIFSTLCMIVHSAEVFTSPASIKMQLTPNDNYLLIKGKTLVLWIYIVLNSLNLFSGATLLVGAMRKEYVKCTVYLMIWSISLLLGIATYTFHVSTLLHASTLFFGLIIYPIFYIYKIFSLWVVKRFMDEFKNEDQIKIPLLIRRSVKKSRKKRKQDASKKTERKRYLLNTTLAQLKENAFKINGEILHIDFGNLVAIDEKTAVMTAKLDLENGHTLDVAVKTTKSNANFETSCSLLLEMKVLTNISHDNILQFLGACCDYPGHEGKTFLVTEIYPPTSLYQFLVDSQDEFYGSFNDQIKDDVIIPAPFKDDVYENIKLSIRANFCTSSLVIWAHDIAIGMEYLHAKKIVHGFLCTKNIILFDNGLCKITGFSFAAQLFNNKFSSNKVDITGSYPWRWMSVECIDSKEDENFTEKSDVWSYGITLWEMYSLGQCPYADWENDFVQELMIGVRLEKPRFSTTEILGYVYCNSYTIMAACWSRECGERPTFYILKIFFKQILSSLDSYRRSLQSIQSETSEAY